MSKTTSSIIYQGHLRTKATHLKSGEMLVTDAPTDNNGQGAYFSPTDLLATSLGSCMLTLMGIAADKKEFELGKIEVELTKVMGSDPRRVTQIIVQMKIQNVDFDVRKKRILETAALNCPVAKSLHPDIIQDVSFAYV